MDIPQISFPNTDKEFINDPYPYLKELREKSPLPVSYTHLTLPTSDLV